MAKWALVLSGGGSKGMAHVGALQALEQLKLRPDLIVGCSMGAIIGGLYCSGMSCQELIHWLEHRFDLNHHMNMEYLEQPDTRLWKLLHEPACCQRMMESYGLDKPDSILALFRELTGDRLLESCQIPLIITAVDLLTSQQVALGSGSIARAMRASMAIPGVFSPVLHQGMVLVDGGVLDNMPVAVAREHEWVEKVVAVNVGKPLKIEHLGSAMSILAAAVWTAGRKPIRRAADAPSLEINIDLQIEERDFDAVNAYVNQGKKTVLSIAEDLQKLVQSSG